MRPRPNWRTTCPSARYCSCESDSPTSGLRSHDAGVVVGVEILARMLLRQVLARHDEQVYIGALQELRRAGNVVRHEIEADARRERPQPAAAPSDDEHGVDVVGHHQREVPLRGRRIEAGLRIDRRLDLQQQLPHRFRQAFSEGRRRHLSADLRQQLVAEELAQASQRPAHGRLREMHANAGGSDASLGEQAHRVPRAD